MATQSPSLVSCAAASRAIYAHPCDNEHLGTVIAGGIITVHLYVWARIHPSSSLPLCLLWNSIIMYQASEPHAQLNRMPTCGRTPEKTAIWSWQRASVHSAVCRHMPQIRPFSLFSYSMSPSSAQASSSRDLRRSESSKRQFPYFDLGSRRLTRISGHDICRYHDKWCVFPKRATHQQPRRIRSSATEASCNLSAVGT